jgi:hypothetical protein
MPHVPFAPGKDVGFVLVLVHVGVGIGVGVIRLVCRLGIDDL